MKIVLTGGGTAGHISGNMALVPELKKHGYKIDYIGTRRGMETSIVAEDKDITYHAISAGKFTRGFCLDNIRDAFRVLKGIKEASALIKELKPDIVFSKGGFVTVPVVVAAHRNNVPVIIHESDFTPGLANKISAKYADKVCTTFPETVKMFKNKKTVCTGTPLRQEIFCGNKEKGRAICSFTDNKPVIMVMGGSLGSLAINSLVREALKELLKQYNIIHICGKGGCDEKYEHINGYKQFDFVSGELPHLFALSDITVSRAGANAIFEFLALKIPMLLIPLPKGSSRGDQLVNAESFAEKGYAVTRNQESLNKASFIEAINELEKKSSEIRVKMQNSTIKNGTNNILELIFAEKSKK